MTFQNSYALIQRQEHVGSMIADKLLNLQVKLSNIYLLFKVGGELS